MQRRISDTFPPNDEIPALSAIFEDSALFAVFISMLSTKPKNIDDFSAIPLRKGHTGGFSQKNIPAFNSDTKDQITSDVSKSRKRSLSNSSATSIEQSPKKILCTNSSRELEVSRTSFSNEHRIIPVDFNFSVLAAIIFQISFSYLEYWPAIFAQLYAEDCFGSRIWVDDKRCEGFVSIISSVLKDEGEHHIDKLDEANAFHAGFESFLQGANSLLSNSKSYERLIQAASNDNQHDSDSDEDKSTLKKIAGSVGKAEYHDIRMKHDNESSSSGDEEIEEEELMASLAVPLTSTTMVEGEKTTSGGGMYKHSKFWWKPDTVENFDHSIRYIGSIRERAHQMIGIALEARLSEKTKQNSSLLTSLQSYLVVPHVRSLVAAQLEKWLQSPAVSGLGRTLFSSLVASIKKVDPLLPEDARALNSVLTMPLKQNQFQMHTDNLINLIQRIPTLAVTEEIILYTLNDKLETDDDVDSSKDIGDDRTFDLLKAIFKIVSVRVVHIALAKSILSILNRWYHEQSSTEDDQVIRLCVLLNKVVVQLNDKYDGQVLISEMLSEKNLEGLFTTRRAISHVVLYAILWMTPRDLLESCNENGQPIPSDSFMQQILESKKIILNWYLTSYTLGGEVNSILHRSKQPIPPNFDSILTGEMKSPKYQDEMEVLLCLMFVMESNSTAMHRFTFYKDQTRGLKAEEYSKRMSLCIANGRVVDDELINILLKCANDKKRQMAGSDILSVIEHMLYACSIDHGATLHINDEYIVWQLFGLSENHYQTQNEVEGIKIACPGLWWRVMVIALVICGKSTNIADVMWDACPTLHVLMKMIITNRFTFPTVDCDESQRIKMEECEYKARKDEYKIAETLFLPQEQKVSKVAKSSNAIINPPKGTRYSARQEEKRMRVLDIELQKQRELEAAEEQRINHLLKEARKSVILLNPRGVARKPPQASMKLLLHSCDVFQLSAGLINCLRPDFVLKTIGNTSRSRIERAYAWLIPIISVYPSVIDRLPSSASCFLLLRAYGKRSENAEKLLKLSSPLLDHVKRSIRGDLDDDAVKRAADLLFYDLKSQDSERRSCARRLLSETLVDSKESMRKEQNGFSTEFQWLAALTELKHRKLVLDYAIPCLVSKPFLVIIAANAFAHLIVIFITSPMLCCLKVMIF
jgi:integrator complex subunit 1